jgi:NADPH2:quinone reductase
MHALSFDRFGGPDVLTWRSVTDPDLGRGQALVRIKAAGLNFADIYRRRGDYHMDATPPWILGYEGAGVIEAVSGDDCPFSPGDRVGFADAPRANAELAAIPADKLVLLPAEVSFDQAAAVLLQGLTAQYLVNDSYTPKRGATALVHAAGGGVGLLLVQMLKRKGARVVALASSEAKRAAARDAGADDAIGYEGGWSKAARELTGGAGVDVVYESVGTTLSESLAAARIGGTVVFYGFAGGNPPPIDARALMDRSLTITGGDLWNVLTSADERRRRAGELLGQLAEGKLKVKIAERIPMSEGARAHALLEGRGVIGKIVLTL